MGSPINLTEFRRRFCKYGVEFSSGGKHLKMRREIGGVVYTFPLPTMGGRRVKDIYEKKARRRFKLLPKDGVSNEDFYS